MGLGIRIGDWDWGLGLKIGIRIGNFGLGIWDVFFKFGSLRGEGGEGWRCMYSRSGRGGRQAERLRWFGWEGRLPTSPERD